MVLPPLILVVIVVLYVINSIKILELIAWTERATGRVVPDALIRLDNFATAQRIAEVFATEDSNVAA